jgi:hypothetical protein
VSNKSKIERFLLKQKYLITGPIRGYLTDEAREVIARLEKAGFDPDLAFAFAEGAIPEDEFYHFPEDDSTEGEEG